MFVYVYVSDATEQTIITGVDHGITWVQADGEVYDLLERADLSEYVITLDCLAYGRPASAHVCTEKDLDSTIVA